MKIEEQYKEKKYDEIIQENLTIALNKNAVYGNREFENLKIIRQLTLESCFEKGYYADCIRLIKKINDVGHMDQENIDDRWRWYNILIVALESLIYYLFNPRESAEIIKADISSCLEKTIDELHGACEELGIKVSEASLGLEQLFTDYKQGKIPYYKVKFLYPYEPMFEEYTFDLKECPPYISLKVEKVSREHDNYTSFEFTVYGYTKADTVWQGPEWDKREKFPAVKKTLPLLNLLLLFAVKATPGQFTFPYMIEQVTSVDIGQYNFDGSKTIHRCMGTDFTSQMVGGNAPRKTVPIEAMPELNRVLVSHYGSDCFVALYHQARNNISAGLYVESFVLFCTVAESMLYYWCGRLAARAGLGEEYRKFSEQKVSKCDSCELFKQHAESSSQKQVEGYPPSAFAHVDFLLECGVKKKETKELKSLLSKARKDSLRNDVVHGRTNNVSLKDVRESDEAILKMQEKFLEIEKHIMEEK